MNHSLAKLVLLIIVIFTVAGPVFAEVYKWTDEDGIIHYSDKKPKGQEVTELEFPVTSYESVSYGAVSDQRKSTAPVDATSDEKVILFSASWCGTCKKAKRYFRRKGVRFTEYDIEKSSKGRRLYRNLGATGVPVILVGKKRMNGFSEAGFERMFR